ncbi:glycosyltransferase [Microcoleus sp. SVA1_B6]|uniref:glycosyltransferase n=2 Tax=Microcoleus TaxID=44471 RepID=UPI002FD37AA5
MYFNQKKHEVNMNLKTMWNDFQDFTYSKQSHFYKLPRFSEHIGVDHNLANLKLYQDLLAYNFIVNNVPPGSKVLEVGGGNSRVIEALKQDYECWNIDKFEGSGNGPREANTTTGYRLIFDYMGHFNAELPSNYFDCVFSISALEHVPETEETFKNICDDINRVLNPDGFSLHCFDIVIKKDSVWTNAFLYYIFKHIKLQHEMIPFTQMKEDPDLYVMSEFAYNGMWEPVTQCTYEDFGKPLSYNVLWKKNEQKEILLSQDSQLVNQLTKTSTNNVSVVVNSPLPKISIVTPSFNQGEFLEECIDSILSQGYPNLEYIIMDGGSTDLSLMIIKKYEKYLTYWQTQPDGGHYVALNKGFSKTTGEIMAWLNSDDKYHPDAFFKVAAAFAKNQHVEWLTGRATTWNREGILEDVEGVIRQWSRNYLFNEALTTGRFIQQESTFWKRSIWQKVGSKLHQELKLAADFDLWMRFSRHAQLFLVDDLIGGFRTYATQRSRVFYEQYVREVEDIVNREHLLIASGQYTLSHSAPQPIKLLNSEVSVLKRHKILQDRDVLIVTSIAPGKVENQRAAVESWLSLGFHVVSLNNHKEVKQLKPLYQNVTFHAVERDAQLEAGRPLIYLDDIFQYLRERGTKICGIVNSDICLKADKNFIVFACQQAKNAMVLASRVDVNSPEERRGETYIHGFDAFFFDKQLLEHFPTSRFCLGLPWWDYFVPLVVQQREFVTKYIVTNVAYHVKHQVNYSQDLWQKMGIHFTEFFDTDLSRLFQKKLQENPTALSDDLLAIAVQFIQTFNRNTQVVQHENETQFKVSAIVSTYNSEMFISGCLQDLVRQTLYQKNQLEIIVIDSNSEQDERSIVLQFQETYPHIIYERTLERESVYAAWNRAIKMSHGKYITNANTDDRHRPDALEVMASYLDNHAETGVIYADQLITTVANDTWETTQASQRWNWPPFNYAELERCCIVGSQPMWRKAVHEKYGYFRANFSSASDYEFWLRIGKKENIVRLPDILGLYYHNPNGLSTSPSSYGADETDIILNEYGIPQSGVISKSSVPVPICISDLKALPYRTVEGSLIAVNSHANLYQNVINPLVSVIIPTKDRPEMLAQAVQSVLNQTFSDIEIIVINDGGIDVQNVLDPLNLKRNIIYLKHDQNLDRSAARNTGIHAASGKYIAYLDDDDTYHPNHVETLVNFLENSEYKAAYTDAVMAEQQKQNGKYVTINRTVPYSLDFDNDKILVNNFIPIPCLMHEKFCLDEVGVFDINLGTHEDWDLLIRLSRKFRIAHIKATTCEFVWRNDGSTTTSKNRADFFQTRELIYRKYTPYAKGNSAVIEAQNLALQSDRQEALVITNQSQPKQQLIQSQLELTQYQHQLKQALAELERLKAQLY